MLREHTLDYQTYQLIMSDNQEIRLKNHHQNSNPLLG